jgi:hypothetical protein
MMVWRTSRGLTAASLVLRLVRAVLPVVTLYVGKLIIDNVVLLVQAPDKPETLGLWLGSGLLSWLKCGGRWTDQNTRWRASWAALYLGIAITGVEALIAMGLVIVFM